MLLSRPVRMLVVSAAVCLVATGCGSDSAGRSESRSVTHTAGLAASLSGVGTLPAPASAWPAASYDARHSSGTSAVGPQHGTVRWEHSLGGNATPGPVIGTDGSILAATNAGVLHALDPATGKEIWSFDGGGDYGSDLSTSPAVVSGGTILWPGPRNTLYALDQNGRELWTERFDSDVLSPAVAGNNRVYVADMSGHLAAIEVTGATHRRLWSVNVGGTNYGSPTVGPEGNIYTASDNDLVAVRDLGAKGAILWRFHARKMVEVSNGVAADGTVFLGTNHDRQFGVAPDGSIRWSIDIGDYTYSSSVVRPDGIGYVGDNMGRLRIIDTRTGKVGKTIAPLGNGKEKIWSAPIADAKDNVYWATTEGNVYGYTSAGTKIFAKNIGSSIDSYPALGADGTLYVSTVDGDVVAIG